MIKKIMLLALAAASFALFALPALASAQEIHLDTAATFTGTGGAGSLVAEGEPTITCESTEVNNGTISTGGTTGTMNLDFKGCHTSVFGLTAKCHTTGSAADNTVASGGTFHLIKLANGSPAVLVTANTTVVVCAGISNTHVEGSIIGTITSPACEASSSTMTLNFTRTGFTQDHELYTGASYGLTATTIGGSAKPAALNTEVTLNADAVGTLTCT
jgi:hypothetical protein